MRTICNLFSLGTKMYTIVNSSAVFDFWNNQIGFDIYYECVNQVFLFELHVMFLPMK